MKFKVDNMDNKEHLFWCRYLQYKYLPSESERSNCLWLDLQDSVPSFDIFLWLDLKDRVPSFDRFLWLDLNDSVPSLDRCLR